MSLRFIAGAIAAGALSFFAMPSLAAQTDCPPLGHLPTYEPGNIRLRDFAGADFDVAKGDTTQTQTVSGRLCKQDYTPKDGTDPLSDLEIQSNYRDQIGKLGGTITSQGDRDTYAVIKKDGKEFWVHIYSQETEIDVTVVEKKSLTDTLTAPSGADYSLIGHMPGYVAGTPKKRNFDQDTFTIANGDSTQDTKVQGKLYSVNYTPKDDAAVQSDLAIQQNYRDALKKLGAQILWTDDRNTTARLEKDGKTIWIKIYSQETEVDLTAVEEKPFEASIQTPKADAMKAALDKAGHIALYIHFDFNKATLKPDAKPILDQVLALLKNNPTLKLSIEGHTDNIGTHDYNVQLSQARAAAVVAALVAAGIDKGRLTSKGFGPDKPVADNSSEEGRAKNRRVELVKM